MSKHSKLSPSGAHRWMKCPASVRLSENIKDTNSVYAREGTLAHQLAACVIGEELLGEDHAEKIREIEDDKLYSRDMGDYVTDYLSYVETVMHEHTRPILELEKRVEMKSISPEIYGTADCLIISEHRLDIIDFKYGANVEVNVLGNEQLRLYAIGALEAYDGLIFDINTVGMHIAQPRMNNFEGEIVPKTDLITWGKDAKVKAREALKGDTEPVCGEHCKFCKAKVVCRAYADQYDTSVDPTNPNVMTYQEIAERIGAYEGLSTYLKELKSFALSQALDGHRIPGYKVVEGRSNRQWGDREQAFTRLTESGIEADSLYQKKPLTPPQVEKLVGKKKFKEIAEFVEKPAGKPTLAKETDKRKEYTPTERLRGMFSPEGVDF